MLRWSMVGVALFLLGGCAVGVKHDYDDRELRIAARTPASVAVGAIDNRPYVIGGQKAPNFVGVSRGGFGNPFDVTTQSGRPLVSDMASTIARAMKAGGMNAQTVDVRPTASLEQAKAALRAAGQQRSVLLALQEWKADSMVNVGLNFQLALHVLDQQGNVLASRTQQGTEKLGAADPFRPGGAELVLPRFRRMIELMFEDVAVQRALQF